MEVTSGTVGKGLQAARRSKGYKSARSFAEAMGMPYSRYVEYEQGRVSLPIGTAWWMADFLGMSIDELVGRESHLSAPAHTREEEELVENFRKMQPHERTAVSLMAASLSENSGVSAHEMGVA